MSPRIRFSQKAQADLRRTIAYYSKQRRDLDDDFLGELRTTLKVILERPGSFPKIHRNMRRAIVNRFPYGVFFRESDDLIRVAGVIHLHRNPKVWLSR